MESSPVRYQNPAHVHAQSDVMDLAASLAAKADKVAAGDAGVSVTGIISPDATGTYAQNGTYNSSPAYERVGGGWWLRYDMYMPGMYYWRICQGTTVSSATPLWNGSSTTSFPGTTPNAGTYTPMPGAAGAATVSAGGHSAVDYLASFDSNGNLTLVQFRPFLVTRSRHIGRHIV